MQTVLPAECLAEIIGGAGGHHGNGDEGDANDADREQNAGEMSGKRFQRGGSLRCGVNVVLPGLEEG